MAVPNVRAKAIMRVRDVMSAPIIEKQPFLIIYEALAQMVSAHLVGCWETIFTMSKALLLRAVTQSSEA
uniref:Uncharacterized protein n=1 Tax=Magnetococcus massalia (strain MO-1) TaxID=451514 RepID=A0A1S7LN97_MAGMO|nr:Protein of unknown function [Candidatus Magnetococcus massalia]